MGLCPTACMAHTRSGKRLNCWKTQGQPVSSNMVLTRFVGVRRENQISDPQTKFCYSEYQQESPSERSVPFWFFHVGQRLRGRPALVIGTATGVGVVGLWLLGRVFPPDGCTPPNLFDFFFGDVSGRTSKSKESPFFLLRFVHWGP